MEWIPQYEGLYKATRDGHIYSYRKEKPIKLTIFKDTIGYSKVNLSKDARHTLYYVHHLIMLTFVSPRPEGYVITHLNRNKDDNSLYNLKYIPQSSVFRREGEALKAIGIDDKDVIYFRSLTAAAKYFHTNQLNIKKKIVDADVYKGYFFYPL